MKKTLSDLGQSLYTSRWAIATLVNDLNILKYRKREGRRGKEEGRIKGRKRGREGGRRGKGGEKRGKEGREGARRQEGAGGDRKEDWDNGAVEVKRRKLFFSSLRDWLTVSNVYKSLSKMRKSQRIQQHGGHWWPWLKLFQWSDGFLGGSQNGVSER